MESAKEYAICIRSLKEMMDFTEAARELQCGCEVVSGRYRVNAKSLMAMLSVPESGAMRLLLERAEPLPDRLKKYLRGGMPESG